MGRKPCHMLGCGRNSPRENYLGMSSWPSYTLVDEIDRDQSVPRNTGANISG